MNRAITALLENYTLETRDDYETAVKEIVQHLALLGLWRSKFYEHAAFYGGTALRLFYGLRRFSEDLDFSLITKNEDFDFVPHLKAVEKEVESFGFQFSVEKREKAVMSQIESAFIKGNTRINLLSIEEDGKIGLPRFPTSLLFCKKSGGLGKNKMGRGKRLYFLLRNQFTFRLNKGTFF